MVENPPNPDHLPGALQNPTADLLLKIDDIEDDQVVDPTQDQDTDTDGGEYFLLEWGAPPDKPVPTTEAKDAVDASERFLPEIKASRPYPLWEDGEPPRPLAPELRTCITTDGGKYLVGEVEWPDRAYTHGERWAAFTEDEIAFFKKEWAVMDRRWDWILQESERADNE